MRQADSQETELCQIYNTWREQCNTIANLRVEEDQVRQSLGDASEWLASNPRFQDYEGPSACSDPNQRALMEVIEANIKSAQVRYDEMKSQIAHFEQTIRDKSQQIEQKRQEAVKSWAGVLSTAAEVESSHLTLEKWYKVASELKGLID